MLSMSTSEKAGTTMEREKKSDNLVVSWFLVEKKPLICFVVVQTKGTN